MSNNRCSLLIVTGALVFGGCLAADDAQDDTTASDESALVDDAQTAAISGLTVHAGFPIFWRPFSDNKLYAEGDCDAQWKDTGHLVEQNCRLQAFSGASQAWVDQAVAHRSQFGGISPALSPKALNIPLHRYRTVAQTRVRSASGVWTAWQTNISAERTSPNAQ